MIHFNVNKMLEKFCSAFSFYLLFKFQVGCYDVSRTFSPRYLRAFATILFLPGIALGSGIDAEKWD